MGIIIPIFILVALTYHEQLLVERPIRDQTTRDNHLSCMYFPFLNIEGWCEKGLVKAG